ncbi:YslB family protein [Salinibacillus xinjiangensis]|uniref:DUF2507 domain-containing protein n=1 Tax=Salinibacillus xinjiangensis TaxID=1229268 RepID=A0A6G1XBJ2_9BACI|nr:YslB family protein [Salinibacillus xinjiangensis]MRG88381.1 DUF2507 domain-containing protein [Salinibacillus xinjiangensis]
MSTVGKEKTLLQNEEIKNIQIPAFGYELIKQLTLPEILGDDVNFVQYYLGKSLARKCPVNDMEELQSFFQQAGFGDLTLIKEKGKELVFQLQSPLITERFSYKEDVSYRLEAGFIAEQLSHIYQDAIECMDETNKRHKNVTFFAVTSL